MSSPADLLRSLEGRFEALGVDVGLASLVDATERAPDPYDGLTEAYRALRDRVEDLEQVAAELTTAVSALRKLRRVFAYTEEGWPRERARLADLASRAGSRCAEAWLEHLVGAAAAYRVAGIRRLVDEGPLPAGHEPLRSRVAGCLAGLEQLSWELAAPLLLEGLGAVGRSGVSARRERDLQRLRHLLARIALADTEPEADERRVERVDVALRGGMTTAAGLALRSQALRATGQFDRAHELLSEAQARDAQDLDVIVALLTGGDVQSNEHRRELATSGINALSSLVDVDADIGELLSPPAELWLAVAERAIRGNDTVTAIRALDQADLVAGWDTPWLLAALGEARADTVPLAERAPLLLTAGDRWLAAPDIPAARSTYERALALVDRDRDPLLWASLVFRRTDCIAVIAASKPLAQMHDELVTSLDQLTSAQQVPGATSADPWCYATELEVRTNLARAVGGDRSDHSWRGFLAAARSTALRPDEPTAWLSLADAAGAIGCLELAVTLARFGVEHLGGADATLAVWLTNSGRYGEVQQRLTESDAWSNAVLAYIRMQEGAPAEAARLLGAITLDPSWHWARETHVTSLVLCGQWTEAVAQADRYARETDGDDGEYDVLLKRATYAWVTGDPDEAVELAEWAYEHQAGLDRGAAALSLAQARLLAGEREQGLTMLAEALALRDAMGLRTWWAVDRPALEAVARHYDVDTSGLDQVDEQARASQPSTPPGPRADLANAAIDGADPTVVSRTRRLVSVLLNLLEDDDEGARTEATALMADPGDDLVAEATAVVRHLETASALTVPVPREPVEDTPEPTPVLTYRLGLPASWFDGMEDPVAEHPIFLHHLPELRVTAAWEIPNVVVYADWDLEPNRWTVLSGTDEVLATGRLVPGARACRRETLEGLPEHLGLAAEPMDDWFWIPEAAFEPDDPLSMLLTLDAAEVAVRELGQAIRRDSAGDTDAPGSVPKQATKDQQREHEPDRRAVALGQDRRDG